MTVDDILTKVPKTVQSNSVANWHVRHGRVQELQESRPVCRRRAEQQLLHLLPRVLAAKAEVHQLHDRYGPSAFGGERSLFPRIGRISHAPILVC